VSDTQSTGRQRRIMLSNRDGTAARLSRTEFGRRSVPDVAALPIFGVQGAAHHRDGPRATQSAATTDRKTPRRECEILSEKPRPGMIQPGSSRIIQPEKPEP